MKRIRSVPGPIRSGSFGRTKDTHSSLRLLRKDVVVVLKTGDSLLAGDRIVVCQPDEV